LHVLVLARRLHVLVCPRRLHILVRPRRLHVLVLSRRLHVLVRPRCLHILVRPRRLHVLVLPRPLYVLVVQQGQHTVAPASAHALRQARGRSQRHCDHHAESYCNDRLHHFLLCLFPRRFCFTSYFLLTLETVFTRRRDACRSKFTKKQ